MLKFCSILFAMLLLAGQAFADESSFSDRRFLPEKLDAVPTKLQWKGFYGGGNFGYGNSGFASVVVSNMATGTKISERRFIKSDGLMAGLFVGYNRTNGNFIWGGEADMEMSTIGGARAIAGGGTTSFEVLQQASLRGRLGYEMGPALVYVTAGLTIADIEYTAIAANGSGNSDNNFEYGYTVGMGIDYALTETYFLRAEYRYNQYADVSFVNAANTTQFDFDSKFHTVRYGVGATF